jgi:hypothetical protein
MSQPDLHSDRRDIQSWDSDHTGLVHVLWNAAHKGLSLDKPDALAAHIMQSRWMQAVRLHVVQDTLDETQPNGENDG